MEGVSLGPRKQLHATAGAHLTPHGRAANAALSYVSAVVGTVRAGRGQARGPASGTGRANGQTSSRAASSRPALPKPLPVGHTPRAWCKRGRPPHTLRKKKNITLGFIKFLKFAR